MVNVSDKAWTKRRAVARGLVAGDIAALCESLTQASVPSDEAAPIDLASVLGRARDAGIAAARVTAQLIPLCHPLPPSAVDVRFDVRPSGITLEAIAEVVAPTGVEMEALTACLFAGLSLISLLGATQFASIEDIVLWEKSGGRSGRWLREQALALE